MANKRTLELEAIRSLKKKVREKRQKAIVELQEFFNRNDSGSSSDSERSNEFLDIIQPKRRFEVYTKNGERRKRFGELEELSPNQLEKDKWK